uniref:Titin n=1 Tax=Xiphophorus maculatus TaxID=8083 RepID=A0A3B5PY49_XIPMA
ILGKPAPTSFWSKGGKYFKPSDLVQIETTPTSSTLSVKYASRKDSGEYIITATNPFGVKEETVKVKVLDVPSAPGPIECSGVSSEKVILTWTAPTADGGPPGPPSKPEVEKVDGHSVTLTWRRPAEDGGSDIIGYSIEKKEKKDTPSSPLRITEFVVPGLETGAKYHFRISAVNAKGAGEPGETQELVQIVEHAAEPDLELDIELRRTLVVRAGCSVRLFVPIKGRPAPKVTWSKEGGPVPRAVIDSTESFTIVSAENEFGIGEAVETTDPIRASQTPTPPESIIPTDITKNSVSLAWTKPKHDGGSRISGYVLEAKKKGTDQWAHVTTVKTMDFTVKNLNENEEYIFHVMAVNQSGRSAPRESKPIIVKDSTSLPEFDLRGVCQKTVIAKAGDDIKVEIPVMGRPRPTISWQKDGAALKLTQRINVETTAATVIISISECTRADSGVYTMTAKNIVGSPHTPEVNTATKTTMLVEWDKPGVDGGSPVIGYYLERRDKKSLRWIRVYKDPITDIKQMVYHLTEGNEYQYRVCAINKAGEGPFSDVSDYYKAADPVGM